MATIRLQATVISAGLSAFTPLSLCFLLPDPEPSITTCYGGNFRLSFRFPCGFLPGGSCLKIIQRFHLATEVLTGYFPGLATSDFSQNFP